MPFKLIDVYIPAINEKDDITMSFIAWSLTIITIYILFFIATCALAIKIPKVADSFTEITIIVALCALVFIINYNGIMFRYHAAIGQIS